MKTVGWKRSKMRSRADIERIFLWISLLFVDCINILEENIVNEYIYIYYKFNTHKTLLQHNLICLRNFCYWIDIYIYYFRSIHLEIAFNSERSFFHHPSPYIYIYILIARKRFNVHYSIFKSVGLSSTFLKSVWTIKLVSRRSCRVAP